MISGKSFLNYILDQLEIDCGDLILLHSSYKYLAHLKLDPTEILLTLLDRLGPTGTLVVPTYAWNMDSAGRPWKGYLQYYQQRPVFDVTHTPSTLGVMTELFRQMPGVERSLSYWWSICALGPLAKSLTIDQAHIVHPYGPGSSFDLLLVNGAKLLGLGVTLNTTSLAPVVDFHLGSNHHPLVFTSSPIPGSAIDRDGKVFETQSFTLLPDVVRAFRPQNTIMAAPSLQAAVKRYDVGPAVHFSYDSQTYHREALELGRQARAYGKPVPWLLELESHALTYKATPALEPL